MYVCIYMDKHAYTSSDFYLCIYLCRGGCLIICSKHILEDN